MACSITDRVGSSKEVSVIEGEERIKNVPTGVDNFLILLGGRVLSILA